MSILVGAVSVLAVGCAHHSESRRDLSTIVEKSCPALRAAGEVPVLSERRPFEIPVGFVRGPCPAGVSTRRVAFCDYEYEPRRISCSRAWELAERIGLESGIDPGIIFGIMRVESAFAVNAMSPAGAVGLMQVMPGPASRLGCGDRLDPVENARCGVIILSRFLKRYDNDLILGLSAYNAGFGMPSRARKKQTIPANFRYPENVLRVRAKFLRWGCLPWEGRD